MPELSSPASKAPASGGFREAVRELASLTGPAERRLLLWLAARLPPWINSDHLTLLGFLAMVAAGACYALTRRDPAWLHIVNVLLVVNWFGDSLDGTLARHRNRLRPRYGFYVDHIVDMYGFLALLAGLALSPYMTRWVALGLLVVYYMFSIHIYLSTYTEGVFKIAYGKVGGTELRIVLIVGNLIVLVHPQLELAGRAYALYDVAGVLGIAAMAVTLVAATIRSTRRLFDLERIDGVPCRALPRMPVRVLLEEEIRGLIGPAAALSAVREAFAALARGEATLPGVIGFDVPAHRGEVHVKGAYLHGRPFYSIKEAAGFYANADKGLPVGSGVVLVFDASTGFLAAVLLDNGYLTELRTGAAGALAADFLARRHVGRVAVIGAGSQARFQLEALTLVRRPDAVVVFSRTPARAAAYAGEMQARLGLPVAVASTAREAVGGSEVVITATPSRAPIVQAEWLAPGAHVTAVGADGPEKQELEPVVLARADKVVVDRLDQCLRLGELHHAVAAGLLDPGDVWAELGELAAGTKRGRESEEEITVADLTGVGVQDAAVANLVVAEAERRGVGRTIE